MNKDDAMKLILSIVACQGAGFLGSIFTSSRCPLGILPLSNPGLHRRRGLYLPSGFCSSLSWEFLCFWCGEKARRRSEVKLAIYVFAAQLMVNILWSAAFFGLRSPLAGLVVIIVLWIMILLTMVKFWPVSRNAALLLVPYMIWVSFAAYLNYSLLMLNP